MTKREKEVCLLLSEPRRHHSLKFIAWQMGLKYGSVKCLTSLMQKKYNTDLIGLVLMGVELRRSQSEFNFDDETQTSLFGEGSPPTIG